MSDLIGLDSLHLLIGLALNDTGDFVAAVVGNACALYIAHDVVICIAYACASAWMTMFKGEKQQQQISQTHTANSNGLGKVFIRSLIRYISRCKV